MPTDSEKVLSERMRVDASMEECDHDCGANAYADEVAALEQRVAAIMEGQELLKAQTVRIRAVLGGSTRDTPDGLPGDTEELARLTMQRIADLEAKLGEYERALHGMVGERPECGATHTHGELASWCPSVNWPTAGPWCERANLYERITHKKVDGEGA